MSVDQYDAILDNLVERFVTSQYYTLTETDLVGMVDLSLATGDKELFKQTATRLDCLKAFDGWEMELG